MSAGRPSLIIGTYGDIRVTTSTAGRFQADTR